MYTDFKFDGQLYLTLKKLYYLKLMYLKIGTKFIYIIIFRISDQLLLKFIQFEY